jgi:hypothetical protein
VKRDRGEGGLFHPSRIRSISLIRRVIDGLTVLGRASSNLVFLWVLLLLREWVNVA